MKGIIYFATLPNNLGTISNVSTKGDVLLSNLIGDTLSSWMREKDCPLELVRMNYGHGHEIIARRRFNDIKVIIHDNIQ